MNRRVGGGIDKGDSPLPSASLLQVLHKEVGIVVAYANGSEDEVSMHNGYGRRESLAQPLPQHTTTGESEQRLYNLEGTP